MYAAIKVYDKEVKELISKINKKAREFDKDKYGLPPRQNFEAIVYDWLHKHHEKFRKELNQ